jgi:hypothetical protein
MELLIKDVRAFLFARSRQFLEDFIDFISGPKTFLRSASTYNAENLARAFSFFIIIYALVNLLFVFLVPDEVETTSLIIFSVAYTVLFFGASLGVLQLSWIVVGARPPLRRVMLCYLFFSGIGYLIQLVMIVGMYMAVHPLEEIMPLMNRYDALYLQDPVLADNYLMENPSLAMSMFGVLAVLVVYLVLDVAWVIVVWGAFRELAGVGRLRSGVALTLYYVLASLLMLFSLSFAETFVPTLAEMPK